MSWVKRVVVDFMSIDQSSMNDHVLTKDDFKVAESQGSSTESRLFAPTEEHRIIDSPKEDYIDLPNLPSDLDTYRLTHLYAEGGTSRVYRAFETHSKQPIAIKLLRRRFQKDSLINKTFLRHGKALSNLRLPHFAKVISVGDSPWGPWWALEWIEGQTLKEVINKGIQWHSQRLLSLMSQLCTALEALHAQGIVHGDLNPHNVIYSKNDRDEEESLTLIDLALPITPELNLKVEAIDGISNELNGSSSHYPKLTAFGHPVYLAPECLEGKIADFRSDLYGLGMLFFELSTGTLPFSTPIPQVIFDILHKPMPSASMRQSPWPYSSSLDALISNLLSKSPNDRLSSISEVSEQINTMLAVLKKRGEYSQTEEFAFSRVQLLREQGLQVDKHSDEVELRVDSQSDYSNTIHSKNDYKARFASARKTEQGQTIIEDKKLNDRWIKVFWFGIGMLLSYLYLKFYSYSS